ncbi:hypothetical protein [Hymenobacter arizonensis]|uniref:SpoIIAA-like n=1 Tax=Hymenobacter arizonensis TaxID=1227077 RepID=A0A1I5XTF5_HYMAR|nr:hypothetical protein [Hymenobacter arizonensis]SFQ35204.1 hypothetical protein SAMN04515668_2031 [Hymenobacter arizonensis]
MLNSITSIYFQNAIGRIVEHPNGYAFVQYHRAKWDVALLRVLLVHLGELLLSRGWSRILVNLQFIEPLSNVEKEFLVAEWYSCKIPRPVSVVTAYVLADNVFARLAIHELQEVARKNNLSQSFGKLEEAEAYLAGLPQ